MFFGVDVTISITRGSALGSGITVCNAAQISILATFGIGYSIPKPVTKLINSFLAKFGASPIQGNGNMPGVYAIGDLIGPTMEMFKARKCGMTAARNILREAYEFDSSEYPDFLHTTSEVMWVGLTEAEARDRYEHVAVIQMPPAGIGFDEIPLACAEGTMLYAFRRPELTGFQRCVIDAESRRILGFHHVGFGAKDAFQCLDYLLRRPGGLTIDMMAQMNALFLNPEHFIRLCRLRAGNKQLVDL